VFGLEILDVVIGLFFGYLVLSLAVTAANEVGAAWFGRRAWMLRKGIRNLLDDDELARRFYDHPLIRSLQQSQRGPSYIPSRTFAMVLLDTMAPGTVPSAAGTGNRSIDRVLALLHRDADGDPEKFRANVETWFNDSMERVSGWYKRRTQFLLLIWAAVVTISTNADTLTITQALWRDPALRQALVASAEQYVAEQPRPGTEPVAVQAVPGPPPLPPDLQAEVDFQDAVDRYDAAIADLAELQLPIGWKRPVVVVEGDEPVGRLVTSQATDRWPGPIWEDGAGQRWGSALREHALGWLLTILALSMGAPFWFDTLNRMMSIRSVGKSPEEAPKRPKEVPTPKEPGHPVSTPDK
jgi:hypothetical protein